MSPDDVRTLAEEVQTLRGRIASLEQSRARRRLLALASRRSVRIGLPLAVVLIPLAAYAVTVPNAFMNGTVANADHVNANFSALADAINAHEPDPSAHHVKTTNAAELSTGTLPDARLSAAVSLLGSSVEAGELGFDPATQSELDVHGSLTEVHHTRYTNAEATAAVGPHVTSIAGLGGGTILGPVAANGELASISGGFRFPDNSLQRSAAAEFPNRVLVGEVSGADFSTIQAAIDALSPKEKSPWLIEIAPGSYFESLTLKSHIHLRGAGIGATVISPPAPSLQHVIATQVTGVMLSRLTLMDDQGTGQGVDHAIVASESQLELEEVRLEGYAINLIKATSGTELAVRRSQLVDPLYDLESGIQLDLSSGFVSDSFFDVADCAVDATRSALTLHGSEILSPFVCANGAGGTPQPVILSHNRMVAAIVSGSARAEIVGNEFVGQFARISLESDETAQVVGNRVVRTEAGPAILVQGAAEVIGNSLEGGVQVDGILNQGQAQILGNTIDVGGTGIVDTQSAVIVGNAVVGTPATAISATATSVLLGNRVPTGFSGDTGGQWIADRAIRVESTSEGVTLGAGGSTVTLSPTGAVTIQAATDLNLNGTNVTITASGVVDLNGSQITLN